MRSQKTTSHLTRSQQKVWKGLAETRTGYLDQFKLSDLLPAGLEGDYVI